MKESKYAKYIVTDLQAPFSEEQKASYATFATRILWMDKNVVPGAFQMNCSWYNKPDSEHLGYPHKHTVPEIIGFFGSNPEEPNNLNAEIELWLEDEMFVLTKSAMIFIPANMTHCPIIIKRVDKPIFHFSVVDDGTYSLERTDNKVG